MDMPKGSASAKKVAAHPRNKKTVVNEHEQLYLVRKPASGATIGFRHHRPKEKRAENPSFAETFDPARSTIDFSDNERGAITKLLSTNAYYRTHPWPAPFDNTTHCLRLGDARDLSWIANESVHLVVTSPPYWTLKKLREQRTATRRDRGLQQISR
jgi:hypothetical protein